MRRLCFLAFVALQVPAGPLDTLERQFRNPPADARIMMRWWWFGPAVQKPELAHELGVMKAAGIGGVEIQPVYPLALQGNFRYLSKEFLSDIGFAAETARQLGMRVDITLGSGWPYGGPDTPVTHAAGRLRVERVPMVDSSVSIPALEDGEAPIAAFRMPSRTRIDFAAGPRIQAPGTSDTAVWFFISSRTGQQVKRAALGAEGFVLDHYSREAVEEHLSKVGEPLVSAFGGHPPYAVFSDSLEVAGSDWTPALPNEFRKRRGYDLIPHLPALVDDSQPDASSVRHDWGETLTELAEENYLTPLREWAHAHHTLLRSQNYGEPPVILSSNALVDLAEGEHAPEWRGFTQARWASSANHLYGRVITSTETWTWLHSPAFAATPLDMKAEADLHFVQGINQLVGHGWPYSPPGAVEPGWRFYAAGAFNDHNPWFAAMPDLAKYLQRVSFLMRQGEPVNDVALYLPTDAAWSRFKPGSVAMDHLLEQLLGPDVIPHILNSGFNFDYIDDRALKSAALRYKAIVVPPGQPTPKGPGNFVESTRDLKGMLQPDLEVDASAAPVIGFAHRALRGADIYFLANTGNTPLHTSARFRGAHGRIERWDPFTGKVTPGLTRLDLAPYESEVLVFSDGPPTEAKPESETASIDLDSDWQLSFANTQGHSVDLPHSWTADESKEYYSGTATYTKTFALQPDDNRYILDFGSGTPVTAARTGEPGMRAWLDSPVREAAVVYVNEKHAGIVWHPPYELDITPFLKPGTNTLRIEVGNTAINELAGQSLPDYRLLNLRYGERFTPQGMRNLKPVPSGLVGRVVLRGRRGAGHEGRSR